MASDRVPDFIVYSDGACSGNPGPGGWGAVILGLDDGETAGPIPHTHPSGGAAHGHVWELGGGEARTTNNRMEMTAALEALRFLADKPGVAEIRTDSSYVVHGITKWVHGWLQRGWKTSTGEPVVNQDLWEALLEQIEARGRNRIGALRWVIIPGHAGIPGNERADRIAVASGAGDYPALYDGPYGQYTADLLLTDADPELLAAHKAKKKRKPPKGGYYISYLDGVVARHDAWAECEARVKGRSGAKFKKVADEADEASVLQGWGVKSKG